MTFLATVRSYFGVTLIMWGAKLCKMHYEASAQDTQRPESWASVLATDEHALLAAGTRILASQAMLRAMLKDAERRYAREIIH